MLSSASRLFSTYLPVSGWGLIIIIGLQLTLHAFTTCKSLTRVYLSYADYLLSLLVIAQAALRPFET